VGLRILAIDPSIRRIGWALFEVEPDRNFDSLATWNYGTFSPPSQGRTRILADVKSYFSKSAANHVVCELPAFFESEKGRIAAKSGYTIDLALVIGTIYGITPDAKLYLYTPQQWKGSVSKGITQARFKRVFQLTHVNLDHDTVDAIMLLRHHVTQHFSLTPITTS
jgi:Holliday junction resolvasome RuvABC endonuclease subunit